MSKESLNPDQVLKKYQHAMNADERQIIEDRIKRNLLSGLLFEFSCAGCGTCLHQVERPHHRWSSDQTWHSLTCPSCHEVTVIGFVGEDNHVTVIAESRLAALTKRLASRKQIVCPEHGNEVAVLTVRPSSKIPVKVVVKHSPCEYEQEVGFFVTKRETRRHTESEINLVEYQLLLHDEIEAGQR